MAVSLDDILTTQKNGVVAINGLNQMMRTIYKVVSPSTVSSTIPASTTSLVVAGSGVIFSVSITSYAGAGTVSIYNSATAGGIAATNLIYKSLPASSTIFNPYQTVTLAYTSGIVIVTDAGMQCCVTYTPS